MQAFNAFTFASKAGSSIKFDLQLGIAEQTLVVGMGSAVVGTVGLAAGWHTITYALLHVFPPIAVVAAIASAVAGFATQDIVVNQRKKQISKYIDDYKNRFLSLLDHEPLQQLGNLTVRKYINYCNEQIIIQACKQWEKAFKFSMDDFENLNDACIIHLQYLDEAKEDIYYQKTRNAIEEQHRQNRVSFANESALTDDEIRAVLSKAFMQAQKEIDIASPWISKWVLEPEFSSWLEAALKKGITIKIVYGMIEDDSLKKRDSDRARNRNNDTKKNAKELERRYDKYVKKGLFKMRFGNTHTKLLICDDLFYVIGSFNWLSFKGDYTEENTRRESAEYSENRAQLEVWRDKIFDF